MTQFKEESLQVLHLAEPELTFGYGQRLDHPRDGLFLYGPYAAPTRREITIGVVGTSDGIALFRAWLKGANRRIGVPKAKAREKNFSPHLSDFPGLEEGFAIRTDPDDLVACEIDPDAIEHRSTIENHHEAVSQTVDLFIGPIESHVRNEERAVDVWVLAVPEIVFERCRPQMGARRKATLQPGMFSRKKKERADLPLLDGIIDNDEERVFDDIPDFHRQVKARLLRAAQSCQLIRETTLAPNKFLNRAGNPIRGTQDAATIAWNLATGLYYKNQASPPWKIANMRNGVCYIGLVFKLIPNHKDNHACCAAQMFLSEGDGVVFRGANGPWQTADKEFHLSKDAAKRLVDTVLQTYRTRFGDNPKELFIHDTTKFRDEEWEAFAQAAPPETNLVAVRIRPTHGETKLFRDGDYPCIRVTALVLNESNAYLWTSGYVPRIDTYLGPETPNPIHVTVLRSTGPAPDISGVLS
ncbi:MAG: hypothetical protein AAF405_07965, partial [Pseudomonadota bacterium]